MVSKKGRFILPLLHIDDNPAERLLVQQAIRATDTPFDFHGADGLQSAVDYFLQSAIENFPLMSQPGRLPGHPRPALVLLDYDLSGQCGTDFLYWLRTLHRNTALPVIMYTGSAGDSHISECYAHGATHFLRKSRSFQGIMAVLRTLHVCFSLPTPQFQFLARLPESEPDPRAAAPVLA